MKCIIYVFSGTGNTRLIANLYQEFLPDYQTEIYDIKSPALECPNPNDYDLIGFGHPVHGFNAPKLMYDFCKELPVISEGKKTAFVFTTSGEGLRVNNFASQMIVRKLESKGYHFIQQQRYVMPYNMIFRHSPQMVKSEYIYAKKLAEYSCKNLLSKKETLVHRCNILSFYLPIVRILWLYAKIQSPFMKVDMNKCIKCNKCIKACPYGNISFDSTKNQFKFGNNCLLCVACSFGCPKEAISIGLLNGWRINGDYKILQTSLDDSIEFPYFTSKNLKGLKRLAYLKYFQSLDKLLE